MNTRLIMPSSRSSYLPRLPTRLTRYATAAVACLVAFTTTTSEAQGQRAVAAFSRVCDSGLIETYGYGKNNAVSCEGAIFDAGGQTQSKNFKTTAYANAGGGQYGGNTYSEAVHTDVVVFFNPDASPINPIPVELKWKANASLLRANADHYSYLGAKEGDNCRNNDFEVFKLPEPKDVQGDRIILTFVDGAPLTRSGTVTLRLYGPRAVLPLMICARANSVPRPSDDGQSWQSAVATVNGTMSLVLPSGVTCKSKSGVAFNGQCGKL